MKIVAIIAFFIVAAIIISSCGSNKTSVTSSLTQTSVASSITLPAKPIEVTSVAGPLPPINPGGPNIEITLKNITNIPLISVSALLKIDNVLNKPFKFSFAVSETSPLLPGSEISSRLTLINGGFDSETSYPLEIIGSLQTGGSFDYTTQVKITEPAITSTTTAASQISA